MAAVASADSTTCSSCGAALAVTSSPALGCMACLLRAALDAPTGAIAAGDDGAAFGQYVIEQREDGSVWELGRGAMGVTYRAFDTALERVVALKIINLARSNDGAAARERFLREARAAGALRDRNIATVYQFGVREETGQCFYAMEFVDGETLEERVRRTGPLRVDAAIEVARQVADALVAAQQRGLVHRDIKPANLMIVDGGTDEQFTVKVIDFGLAKAIAGTDDPRVLTHDGFVGTPAFASPEQWNKAPVDVRSDIYSLGATLWYLLTGQTPFGRADAAPLPMEQLKRAQVGRRLGSLLREMLSTEPAERPAAADVAARLAAMKKRDGLLFRRGLAAAVVLTLAIAAAVLLQPKPATEAAVSPKSIAVLPFESIGSEKEDGYFADGVHDELLTNLARVADLKVISRTSVMQYRGGNRNARAIGRALHVGRLVEGSVRKSGSRVRVNVELIDAATDANLWAEQYERDVADVFTLQSELAERIASRLKATLSPAEKSAIEATPTTNVAAYDAYLRAKELIFERGASKDPSADTAKAIELLNTAVAADGNFALAYCLLSRAHVGNYWSEGRSPAELEQARLALEAATRLAPDAGETHLARGFYFFHGIEDNERALSELAEAVRRAPGDAEALRWLGILERRTGRWDEAVRDLSTAMDLDPHNSGPPIDLVVTYEMLRRYSEAQLVLDRGVIAIPQITNRFRTRKADIALMAGDTASARVFLDSLPPDYLQGGAIAYLRARLARWTRDYGAAERALSTVPLEGSTYAQGWVARDRAFVARAEGDPIKIKAAFRAARDEWARQLAEAGDKAEALSLLALWDAGLGDKEAAMKESQQAVDARPLSLDASNAPTFMSRQALAYAWCGDVEGALNKLQILVNIPGEPSLGELKLDPNWDVLRGEPRFQQLVAQLERR